MGAPTESYVDPSIAGNSGSGLIGDPWGDLQYALNQITRDASNGDRFNIKAGTDEVLAATLDFTSYGVPARDAPLIFQGYTAAQGDGGIGGIDGNGTSITATTLDYFAWIDLHLHNAGANDILAGDLGWVLINCEIDNQTTNSAAGIDFGASALILKSHFHNIEGHGVDIVSGTVAFCTIEDVGYDMRVGIHAGTSVILFNVMDMRGSDPAISITGDHAVVCGNSIYASGGATGKGIYIGANTEFLTVINNIIEGYSGVGGAGISFAVGSEIVLYGFNAFYNNATNLIVNGDIILDLRANDQALGASPFTDAANDDFTVGEALKALGYPTANFPNLAVRTYLDMGALQREEAAGGGGLIFSGMVVR